MSSRRWGAGGVKLMFCMPYLLDHRPCDLERTELCSDQSNLPWLIALFYIAKCGLNFLISLIFIILLFSYMHTCAWGGRILKLRLCSSKNKSKSLGCSLLKRLARKRATVSRRYPSGLTSQWLTRIAGQITRDLRPRFIANIKGNTR